MKKIAMALFAMAVSANAFAGTEKMTCKSVAGSTLQWNNVEGKLTVINAKGGIAYMQDKLAQGSSKYNESIPGWITPIYYMDESTGVVAAEIVTYESEDSKVELDGVTYGNCQ